MGLVDQLIQQAGQKIDSNLGAGHAANVAAGAQIVQHAQELQMRRAEHDKKKQELEGAKMEKFVDAIQKGANYEGAAQNNYFNKVLPRYRDSLGLTEVFPTESLQFATATPENRARLQTLIGQVQNGELNIKEAIAVANDPVAFADVPPFVKEAFYKDVTKANETRIGAEAQANALRATNSRFQQGQEAQVLAESKKAKQALGDDLVRLNIPAVQASLAGVESIIPGGFDGYKGQKIAGVSGPEAKLPVGQLSPEGRRNRMKAMAVANQFVKLTTGAGGSTPEMNRIMSTLGITQAVGEGGGVTALFTGSPSSADFVRGMQDMQKMIDAQSDTFKNAYGEDIYNEVVKPKGKTKPAAKVDAKGDPNQGVQAQLQALYDKYATEPEKQKKIKEAAEAKGIKLKGK